MTTRRLIVSLTAFSLGLCLPLRAADAQEKPQSDTGFLVVTEISFDEQGIPVGAKIVQGAGGRFEMASGAPPRHRRVHRRPRPAAGYA